MKRSTTLAMVAMMAGAIPFIGGRGYSAYARRHDPDRVKTPEDLANIEAARLKREKRNAKRNHLLVLCLSCLLSSCTLREALNVAGDVESIARGSSYIKAGLAVADAVRSQK